jgi:hypothetical protein
MCKLLVGIVFFSKTFLHIVVFVLNKISKIEKGIVIFIKNKLFYFVSIATRRTHLKLNREQKKLKVKKNFF